MSGRSRKWIAIVAAAILVVALFPIRSLHAPSWDVAVTDESGVALKGILVRESYQDYSAEFQGGEESLITDELGHVRFEPKTLSASPLKRLIVTASSATGGVHASFGPSAYLLAFGDGSEGAPEVNGRMETWHGSPNSMKSRIVMHPRNSP
jgi:hypothetical protein